MPLDFRISFGSATRSKARLTGAIRHPNVVPTLDVVKAEGELLMVMEHVAGESVARLLLLAREKGAPATPRIGVAIVAGALAGLHAAHEARAEDGTELRIVHRDVSPQNILVGRDGIPRLVDFGIARAAVRAQVTREGQLKGKLRYMAPEQLRRKREVDRRADVYAAGVVLWEVLTGRKLFDGESDAEVFGDVLEGVIEPPSALARVPAELDRVVLRALAREPEERFATALEMAEALGAALPPASAAEVGAWVEALVGDVLAERAARVAALGGSAAEHGSQGEPTSSTGPQLGPNLAAAPPRDSAPPQSGPVSVRSRDFRARRRSIPAEPTLTRTLTSPALADLGAPEANAEVPRAPRPRRAPIGTAIALSAAALAAAFLVASRRPADPTQASLATAKVTSEPPRAVDPAPLAPSSLAPSSLVPIASASASPPPSAAPSASALTRLPRARSRCVPPYYVDGEGIRRVKRECL